MAQVPNHNKSNHNNKAKVEKNVDSEKLNQRPSTSQKFANQHFEDDDESGGGHGKQKQSSFKLEKLVGLLEKGKMKAQSFWRFLNKEGLDSHDTKKTTLGKQTEKATDATLQTEKFQEVKENQERINEVLEEKQLTSSTETEQSQKSDKSWERAKAVDDSAKLRFGFQDSTPFATGTNSAAEATRRAVMGNRLQGSIVTGTTNPLGFTKQTDVIGDSRSAAAQAFSQTSNATVAAGTFRNKAQQAAVSTGASTETPVAVKGSSR